MNIRITPGLLSGKTKAIPSKSQAHRMLICAAFAQAPTRLVCSQTNRDIQATAQCLTALGADIHRTEDGYEIHPAQAIPAQATLPCRDSGSTLRFLLPVVGALGVDATFMLEGTLDRVFLSPLWEEMERMGCCLSRPTPDTIRCQGKLKPGGYQVDGGISSQFITGLLFAAALIPRCVPDSDHRPAPVPSLRRHDPAGYGPIRLSHRSFPGNRRSALSHSGYGGN